MFQIKVVAHELIYNFCFDIFLINQRLAQQFAKKHQKLNSHKSTNNSSTFFFTVKIFTKNMSVGCCRVGNAISCHDRLFVKSHF